MTNINLKIKNFPAQQAIFDSQARFKIVVKGRRFGLTRGAANNFIQEALEGSYKRGLWVDTVNVNIDRYVERYFLPSLSALPQSMYVWRKQAKILQIRNSFIDFRSSDKPENLEGFGYDKLFLNEAGIILNDEYLWHNAIQPMLWEFKPKSVIGGTPKGKNLFYKLNQMAQNPEHTDYELFKYTSFDNPHLDTKSLEEDMKLMPDRVIQQEIYANFLEDTGSIFRNVRAICSAVPSKPISGHTYVVGVDLAKTQDWTVIVVYDRANNRQVYQDRFQSLEYPFQKKRIAEISRHYNNALVIIDATGLGDPIADDLIRGGIPVEPFKLTYQTKKELIERLVIYIEQGHISMLRLIDTLAEFDAFTYDITASGRMTYTAPKGFHDDIVIAHGMAVSQLYPKSAARVAEKEESLIRKALNRLTGKDHNDEFVYNSA